MNIIKILKSSISEKGNYCYSLPVETTKEIIKDVKQLQQENQKYKEVIDNIKKIIIDNSYNELYECFNELREERVIEIVNILDIKKDIEIDQETEEIIEKYKEV